MKTLVTIPTYNERDNLERLLNAVLKSAEAIEVLVIDDNSPDGTGDLAEELARRDPRIRVIHRVKKLGLGSATVEAFRFALEKGYDFVLNMDADFSHDPRYIGQLLKKMASADIAIGSRYVKGGKAEGLSLLRRIGSRLLNAYCRFVLGIRARDSSGAFRCYRVSALKRIDFSKIISKGYSFQEELLFRLTRAGLRIVEGPIIFRKRAAGVSKVSLKEMARSSRVLLKLGWVASLGKLSRRSH